MQNGDFVVDKKIKLVIASCYCVYKINKIIVEPNNNLQ
jgi:hypothetical protein